jgi:CheY-like chemotaxis protein
VTKGVRLDGVRVLLVEDDDDTREVLTLGLELQGATVRAVGSATEALRAVQEFIPHVILSDIGLPDGDGCELLRRLRTFYGGRDVPALALSGLGDDETLKRCREVGFRKFLLKPLTFEQVRDEVLALAAPHVGHHAAAVATAPLITRPLGGVPAPLPAD